MAPNKAGRAVAKALAIDLDYRQRHEPKDAVQSAADSFQSIEVYEEREPTVGEVLRHLVPNKSNTLGYVRSLFPFWSWIFHYNWTWMIGDIIAVSTPLHTIPGYHPRAKTRREIVAVFVQGASGCGRRALVFVLTRGSARRMPQGCRSRFCVSRPVSRRTILAQGDELETEHLG
jgi:sodium-independent sulfate anion transporter 11